MAIAVRILTYRRKDGKTPFFLQRALESVKKQTFQDYKVFLIGDGYDNEGEFKKIAKNIIPPEKIYFENRNISYEREKYEEGSMQLWCAGGTKSSNYCIKKLLDEGYSWACNLDHDDYWEINHLESINDCLNKIDENYVFLSTKSTYKGKKMLPSKINDHANYFPVNGDIIHSSVCINWEKIPLRFRDVFEEEGRYHAGDGDMWERMTEYMIRNGKKGYVIDTLTCHHETERE